MSRECFRACPAGSGDRLLEIAARLELERCGIIEAQGDISGQTPDPSQSWRDVVGSGGGQRLNRSAAVSIYLAVKDLLAMSTVVLGVYFYL